MRLLSTTKSLVPASFRRRREKPNRKRLKPGASLACASSSAAQTMRVRSPTFFGDEEVVLHEALDGRQAGMAGVAEPFGDIGLDVEVQPFLSLPVRKCMWQCTAHRKSSALRSSVYSCRLKTPFSASSSPLRHPVEIFADPEQGLQVAQAALAVLDVVVLLLPLGRGGQEEQDQGQSLPRQPRRPAQGQRQRPDYRARQAEGEPADAATLDHEGDVRMPPKGKLPDAVIKDFESGSPSVHARAWTATSHPAGRSRCSSATSTTSSA